jgi:hypothetical protein
MHKMEEVSSCGVMVATTMVSIGTDKSTEKEYTTGQMVLSTVVSGSKMKCMAKESLFGLTDASTKASST